MNEKMPITPTTITTVRAVLVMPRLQQSGAVLFYGTNVLDDWNLHCEDYNLIDPSKCIRLPNYYISNIKDVVVLLSYYRSRNWEILKRELKELY